MNLALQRRRFFVAMTITVVCAIGALAAVVGAVGLHLTWLMWPFAALIVVGFGSHAWLMLGVLRDKSAP